MGQGLRFGILLALVVVVVNSSLSAWVILPIPLNASREMDSQRERSFPGIWVSGGGDLPN